MRTQTSDYTLLQINFTKLVTPISIFILITGLCSAQDVKPNFNKATIGFSAGQYLNDFGLMLTITSPYFIKDRLAARLSGGIQWSENYFAEKRLHAYYTSFQLGLVYSITQEERIRLYGETGLLIIFPNRAFSDKRDVPGTYGVMGLDFCVFTTSKLGIIYFFEAGILLNPAKAEKLDGKPVYSNGITAVTGFRFHF